VRAQKIRPGMVFIVPEWDERFEVLSVQTGVVMARYFRDRDAVEMPIWGLLRDLDEGEIRFLGPERPRTRRQRRHDLAELRDLRRYAKLLDREWSASRHDARGDQ